MLAQKNKSIFGIALCFPLTYCTAVSSPTPTLTPVSYESGANSIRLQFVGRWSGGFFNTVSTAPPAYDPMTQRVFVVSNDFGQVDVLDIANPSDPKRAFKISTLKHGGPPTSVDVKNGILAVTLVLPLKKLPGHVVFFDVNGQHIGGPVKVGIQPNMLAFTSDGRRVIVANAGEANDDYTTDPEGSISIIDLGPTEDLNCGRRVSKCIVDPSVTQIDFGDFNDRREALIAAGVRITGPQATVVQDLEPESLAISPDSQTAWVSLQRNNAMAVVDIPDAKIVDIIPLGFKDHSLPGNGFDASDQDGEINIRPWPVKSFYQPDIFVPHFSQGKLFFITANEGDPRDFEGFTEIARLNNLRLDPVAFSDAENLQQDQNLGRLRVSRVDGDSDDNGEFEEIFMMGSRSFATWTADWRLVFDSGDELEQIAAKAVPAFFNTSDTASNFDQTSDSRGPEPETLAIDQIGPRHYLFIAPERIGGIYAYDITDPAAPIFQQYINYRNFQVDPAQVCEEKRPITEECAQAGDLGPEGVVFIPAEQSPIGVTMIAVTNEVSYSTTLYRIDSVENR